MDTALISGDIIECKGVKLALGVGQTTLSNVDKTNREYIEHQILWVVNKLYGSGTHYINLGVGLPISIYKAKKEEFAEKLKYKQKGLQHLEFLLITSIKIIPHLL